MYRDVITLFNRVGDTWKATELVHVDLNADRAALIAKYGTDCKDRAKLHVRYTPSSLGPIIQGHGQSHVVKEPSQYAGAAGTVAFRPALTGEVLDFFLEGPWDGAATVADSDYEDGLFDYLSETRDGVYTITSCARYSVLPHFEILGR